MTETNCCCIRLVMSRWLVSSESRHARDLSSHASNALLLHSRWHGGARCNEGPLACDCAFIYKSSRLLSHLSSLLSDACGIHSDSPPPFFAINIEKILKLMRLKSIISRKFNICTVVTRSFSLRRNNPFGDKCVDGKRNVLIREKREQHFSRTWLELPSVLCVYITKLSYSHVERNVLEFFFF